jgi:hypothetical protein
MRSAHTNFGTKPHVNGLSLADMVPLVVKCIAGNEAYHRSITAAQSASRVLMYDAMQAIPSHGGGIRVAKRR